METTKKKLSIDELARRMSNEFVPENLDKEMWRRESNDWIVSWHRAARLARKLFAQTAAEEPRPKKPKPLVCEACGKSKRSVCRRTDWVGRRFYSCERCWWNMDVEVFDQRVAAHRAKAAAKKARK